jgi:transglutaminase-like putative cysteine protease
MLQKEAFIDRRKYIPGILLALIVAISPNIGTLPLWIVAWCILLWSYLLFSLKFYWPWPGRILRLCLSCVGIMGLLATFTVRIGPAAYFGLLTIMATLKPFEIQTHRDRMVTIFLAYFIVIASLFQSNSLFITLYMLVSVFITTAALIRINNPQGKFKACLRKSGIILLQALPLMAILFLLFPRLQGSLFGLPASTVAKTGFTDHITLSSVSRLAKSNTEAFRVKFNDRIPPPDKLYWRGIVLDDFDGTTWRRSHSAQRIMRMPQGKNPIRYTVILDPTGSRWLFALDLPAHMPQWSVMDSDYTLHRLRPINEKIAYDMLSYTDYRESRAGNLMLRENTHLPAAVNPRSRALAKRLTFGAGTTREKVKRILAYFKNNGFVFTLNPPVLGANPIDTFLFESKRGYCEHYAVALAFLLRAVDVPTRLVGGYLGGELNKFGNMIIVRQSDAHVWDEVWEPGTGWTRVDPTAVVSPERISGDLKTPQSLDGLSGRRFSRYFGPFSQYIDDISYGWEAITTAWSAWFYAYSYDQQKAFLKKIGIRWGHITNAVIAVAVIFILLSGIIGCYVLIGAKRIGDKSDIIGRYYQKFCERLARIGIVKAPNQGAVSFARQVEQIRPDLKPRVGEITNLYVRLRYGPEGEGEGTKRQFVALIRAFKPGRQNRKRPSEVNG